VTCGAADTRRDLSRPSGAPNGRNPLAPAPRGEEATETVGARASSGRT